MNALVLGVRDRVPDRQRGLPEHYAMSAGTSPARPACSARPRRSAKLLGLDEQQMVWALGIAASQPVGLKECSSAR
jgi:hypothetical protein